MVTPGRTAPLSSLTAPVIVLCATASDVKMLKHINDAKTPIATCTIVDFLIPSPPKEKHADVWLRISVDFESSYIRSNVAGQQTKCATKPVRQSLTFFAI